MEYHYILLFDAIVSWKLLTLLVLLFIYLIIYLFINLFFLLSVFQNVFAKFAYFASPKYTDLSCHSLHFSLFPNKQSWVPVVALKVWILWSLLI